MATASSSLGAGEIVEVATAAEEAEAPDTEAPDTEAPDTPGLVMGVVTAARCRACGGVGLRAWNAAAPGSGST